MSPGAAGVVLAAGVARTSSGEAVQFYVLATVAVLASLGMLVMKKAVHSALLLAMTMVCLAVLYLAQDAAFLGVVQVVVYTGAVMMLFLFVLMLVGVDASDSLVETLRGQRWLALLVGLGFGILLVVGLAHAKLSGAAGLTAANAEGNVTGLARLMFTRYVFAFEVTSALLITAALGAMVLTHRESTERKLGQRERAVERFRTGRQLTPLPSSGVYARHNAVDTPALLPDGSTSELSLSRTLEARGDVQRPAPTPVGSGMDVHPEEQR